MTAIPSLRELLPLVTFHAITRYVQRVRGVDVTPDDPSITNEALARLHCEAVGRSLQQIRYEIMQPPVQLACALKLSHAVTATFRATLSPAGVVKTISERKLRHQSRVRELTRAEKKRGAKKQHRRLKRRPAPSIQHAETFE